MLPFSHLICYRFCVSGGTTVLTTEKPTVIDSTIQSGIKYQRENVVDFTYACPFPQNSTSLRFSVSVSLKVLAEMPPASGPQAWAINTAFLSSTCICSREQHFLPHQSLPNGDNPRSQRKEPRNILCLNAAHLGHGLCLQTQEKEVSQAAAYLFSSPLSKSETGEVCQFCLPQSWQVYSRISSGCAARWGAGNQG